MPRYRSGDRGPAVAQVRAALAAAARAAPGPNPAADPGNAAAASASSTPYDVFDETLDRAVRAFQQERGLTVDGVVDPETWRALESARWRLGDRLLHHQVANPFHGDDVIELQQRLVALGYDAGRCDGWFGARTESALRQFQRESGLSGDGTCGPSTLRALHQLVRSVRGGRAHELREAEAFRWRGPTLAGAAIVVDPGHGGIDPDTGSIDEGWVIAGCSERALVADLAMRLEGRLGAAGATAYLTHGEPQQVRGPLSDADRAAFANATKADLCLSLHIGATPSAAASGVATFYYGSGRDGGSVVGERLAELIQREIVARTDLSDCRTHPKTWELLRATRMPTVRVELGYLSNPGDRERLNSPEFRDTIAEAILVAVQRLFLPPDLDPPTGSFRISDVHALR